MATIGLNNFRYAKLLNPESTGDPIYDGAKSPGKAISCNVEIENYDAELYADDVLVESDKSFKNGTATVTIDDENLATAANLLGHTFQDGVIVRKADDNAPYVGFGRIVMKLVNNVKKYKVEFLYKVKFGEPSVENQTKGEDIEFDTMELEGKVTALLNGKWSTAKEFDSKDDAKTFLESLMTAPATVTLTYDANTGTGTIPAVTGYAGFPITLSDGTGLTKTGYRFLGWGTAAETTTPDITSPYTITENKTIYAVWKQTVTLTYNANSGTGTIPAVTVDAGSSITLSDGTGLTAPSNKVFGGWATSASSTTAVTSPYTISENTTLYAIWNNA